MGLLFHNQSNVFSEVADEVYQAYFKRGPTLKEGRSERRKKRTYEDILQTLNFLEVAYTLDDEEIFRDYVHWLIKRMIHHMPELSVERIKSLNTMHYDLLKNTLKKKFEKEKYDKVFGLLDTAIKLVDTYEETKRESYVDQGQYASIKKTYFRLLKEKQGDKAVNYIQEISKQGIPLEDIYVDVLEQVMREVGALWHEGVISVDEEYYMTSITQRALAQFYDIIFSNETNKKKALVCSVGNALHEIGGRMICDLLSYSGFEATYLGASVTEDALLKNLKSEKPNFLFLSVTMPKDLMECFEIVETVKSMYPGVKIGVGGRAFNMMSNVYDKWNVDLYSPDAKTLLTKLKDEVEV